MSNLHWKAFSLSCILSLLLGGLAVQAQHPDPAGGPPQGRLRMVVILSRHGVRSPTWTQARLNSYSAQPWPSWNVAPGYLTARGYDLIRRFGAFDRSSLAGSGLLSANGCADAAKTYIWADTDQRTTQSGLALAEGMFPTCPPRVHGLAPPQDDPLFHSAKPTESPSAVSDTHLAPAVDAGKAALLEQMQHVLLGCAPSGACVSTDVPAKTLVQSAGKGEDQTAAIALAASFAEDFMLEYADGMPMEQVGWGKVNEPQLRQFLDLHSDYFNVVHRSPANARMEASNLLYHVERTLQQKVEGQSLRGAIGPVDSKVVLLVGHDTSIVPLATLLHLHWTLDGRADDTPPGTELAFELWQDDRGRYSIRMTIAMQTLEQMRAVQELTSVSPPAREELAIPDCGGSSGCGWTDFRKLAEAAIDKQHVIFTEPN